MANTISLNSMRFFAHHGVAQQERTVGNWFEVSLTIACDMQQAILTDDLNGTINYAEVYNVVHRQMQQPSQLLEHVAGRIIKDLQSTFGTRLHGGKITIAKLHPPFKCQLHSVAVTVEF